MEMLDKFRESASAIGTWNTLLLAASRALASLSGDRVQLVKYHIVVQPVAVAPADRPLRTGSFVIDGVAPGAAALAQAPRPPEVLAARFAQGARCVAATRDGRLAGFLWYVPGPYDEDEVRARFVPMPAGQVAWDFDVMILPEYRMGRLFAALWARAHAELAARGVRYTASRISAFNAASVAAHRRLGGRIVGSASFLTVGSLQAMWSSHTPRCHLSWRTSDRPTLAVAAGSDTDADPPSAARPRAAGHRSLGET